MARIGFCVAEAALGVVVGDVGCGKTVAVRAAVTLGLGLDSVDGHIDYLASVADALSLS